MIREKLIDKRIGDNKKFRWRSHEVSRTEGLSDAVFGFAITLLVVSLEVPRTYGDLMQTMRGFGAFAISFTLLFIVWYNQYKFFRRYGLQDNTTMLLNGVLLFVVIFYVYPRVELFEAIQIERIALSISVPVKQHKNSEHRDVPCAEDHHELRDLIVARHHMLDRSVWQDKVSLSSGKNIDHQSEDKLERVDIEKDYEQ